MTQLRRVLVTGATGFVGQHLVPMLRTALPDAVLGLEPFDITDRDGVDQAVLDFQPDLCVHLAGIAAIPAARHDPDRAWAVNVQGSLSLARALLRRAPDCFLLHVSSADVYGGSFLSGRPLDERALLAPANDYAATKAAADLAIGALVTEGLRAVRLRPFNHTGPGQTPDFVVAAFARQIARIATGLQAPVLRVGALDAMRDFLDVRDVCRAYIACVRHAGTLTPGTILNVASGTPRRIGDILSDLVALAGIDCRCETDAQRLRRRDIPRAVGNSDNARRLLEWTPEIAWNTTLTDTLQYWQERVATDRSD